MTRKRKRASPAQVEAAVEALKSDVVARLSHELRGPLHTIIGLADLLRSGYVGRLAADHREYVGDIQAAAERLLGLVDHTLATMDRPEVGSAGRGNGRGSARAAADWGEGRAATPEPGALAGPAAVDRG